ncbi:hypothetical protein FMEAI12_2760007 [Parafrankia sp. Ea1.12]|nr:hypothetical protein FMEAI12_2760007 [Parafrankia sp. Ea1.12]
MSGRPPPPPGNNDLLARQLGFPLDEPGRSAPTARPAAVAEARPGTDRSRRAGGQR